MPATREAALAALDALARAEAGKDARDWFAAEPDRAQALAFDAAGLHFDFSKQGFSRKAFDALTDFAEACGLAAKSRDMAAGELVNRTEGRAALHMALRGSGAAADALAQAAAVREQCRAFARAIRARTRRGATGKPISQLIHIGIGGSDLGPRLLVKALARFADPAVQVRFVASVDPASLNKAIAAFDPETTLVFVVSKSFGTSETLANARAARDWLAGTLGEDAAAKHLAASTANRKAAQAFGVPSDAIFDIWDWVGGRYSIWSSVSLTAQIALGPENFDRFLAGAARMDEHFLTAPAAKNAPAVMALTGFWNRSLLGRQTQAVVPYANRLAIFPAYLQQLVMESAGKRVTAAGHAAGLETGAILWGAEGPNGQHAFFQLLHQGPTIVPADIIAVTDDAEGDPVRIRMLLANALAQAEALLRGRTEAEAEAALVRAGRSEADAARLAPHLVMPGGRPSTMIVLPKLDPESLGALIALYEHMVFAQAVLWDINPFDQWGVELGKTLADALEGEIGTGEAGAHDPSTLALIARVRAALG
ncbi:MAG: glucose-6-phosphate isomerase [Maricaulaceae bacterium]|nr:glucose-6-phosphate isomerase [Maricaulaceae bacterium]